jgi:ATP-dependent DNA helicase Q4
MTYRVVAALDILFIAPERLYDARFLQRLSALEPGSVGLLCVDEAHCVSQWSHNFRPGYLRLDLIFRKQLGIHCPLLGLTATATAMTERSIREKLNIPKEGVWRSSTLRPNLHLTVSIENDRRAALVKLLRSENFAKAKSIIVYAFYRMDVDELTRHLQGQMIKADGYHAGKEPSVREKIQNDFMSGKLHVVVATVAFGMGINKQDVGGVVHYSLPGSMEAYVQEVGRAGRDGNPAYCHLFLNTGDYMRRRSLASSDGLDQITVLTSLRRLFSTNVCRRDDQERVNGWKETQGVFSQTYGSLLTATLHINIVPCVYLKVATLTLRPSTLVAGSV